MDVYLLLDHHRHEVQNHLDPSDARRDALARVGGRSARLRWDCTTRGSLHSYGVVAAGDLPEILRFTILRVEL